MDSAVSAPAATGSESIMPINAALPAQSMEDPAYSTFINTLSYLEPAEIALVEEAYRFSEAAHKGQTRQSGEPYVTHPLAVAGALAEWRMDVQAIVAALLHDVMEDTEFKKSEIAERFGKQVAELVDGVSKLDKIEFKSYQAAQAENFRKMMMAMAHDLRIVLIKLADRYHNLLTMTPFRAEKRRRIAQETLDIYVPIATRLGLNNISRQLQDLSFMHIHPHRYKVLSKAIKTVRGNRREVLSKTLEGIRNQLLLSNIEAGVFGREKSLYSIHHKMVEKHLSFTQVLDIYGFRIIVRDIPACYLALVALHARYKPVPGKFKDYIAIPKINGYQSLHTTLIGPYGTPIEIQIRTQSMHHLAEEGIASHWLYKDSETSGAELQDKTHKWLQSLLETQGTNIDSSEFLEQVKEDLFPEEVYVFTPKGRILSFPKGATVIDFAYAVHTDVGHRCVAARIDHELIPLSAELSNGNQVEIITEHNAMPNPEWLNHVKTGRARSKIRQFLKLIQQEGSVTLGESMLDRELNSRGIDPTEISNEAWESFFHESGKKSQRDVFMAIGLGYQGAAEVAERLISHDEIPHPEAATAAPLIIHGVDGVSIHQAACCKPIPREPIIGQICQDQGLLIHTITCPTAKKTREQEPKNWILTEWAEELDQLFEVHLKVITKNMRGVLGRVATVIAECESNIEQVTMTRNNPGMFTEMFFVVQVSTRAHLAVLLRSLRHIPEVERIVREQE